MRQFDFQSYLRKYGKFILAGLFFLFLINYCNQQPRNQQAVPSEQQEQVNEDPLQEDEITTLKTYEELVTKRQLQENEGPGSFMIMFLLLTFAFGLVWLLQQKRVQHTVRKWLPGRVMFQASKSHDSVTGRRILKIVIVNKTDEGLTFLPPNLVFSKWGKERIFRLKGSNQEDMFPLTLTPGTSHRLVLDLEQFYEKIPDLNSSNRVGASVETTDGKKYRSFALPSWLAWVVR